MSHPKLSTRMQSALKALDDAEFVGKPVQNSDAREKALINGVKQLGRLLGQPDVEVWPINANGNMKITGKTDPSTGASRAFGEELARAFSAEPRYTGTQEADADLLPQNAWFWMNHFRVENLIRKAAGGELDDIPVVENRHNNTPNP